MPKTIIKPILVTVEDVKKMYDLDWDSKKSEQIQELQMKILKFKGKDENYTISDILDTQPWEMDHK